MPDNTKVPPVSDQSLLRVSLDFYDGLKTIVDDGWGSHRISSVGVLASLCLETAL